MLSPWSWRDSRPAACTPDRGANGFPIAPGPSPPQPDIHPIMRLRACLSAALLAATPAFAQNDVVTPPAALVLENVPPIPAELGKKLEPYGDFRPHGMLSWNPNKREMLIRRRLT